VPDKKEIRLPHGQAWVRVSEGVVVGDKTWSETNVYSQGGGARVLGNVLHVDPVSVTSVISEKSEFWIREDDGLETSIRFSDVNFPVRPGQRVRVAWGGNSRQQNGGYLYAHNYASGESMSLVPNWYVWARKNKLAGPPVLYRLLTTWLSLLLALFLGVLFAVDYAAGNASHSGAAQVKELATGYRTTLRDPARYMIRELMGKGERATFYSSDPKFDARLEEATYIESRAAERRAAQTMTLRELALKSGAFAAQGIASPRLGDRSAESQRTEVVGLGGVIALALWIPLYLLFHLLGFIGFHFWWGIAQHKLIGLRLSPLFRV
jgi:hypothetical protein